MSSEVWGIRPRTVSLEEESLSIKVAKSHQAGSPDQLQNSMLLLGCLPQGSLLKESIFDVPENWTEQKDSGEGTKWESMF